MFLCLVFLMLSRLFIAALWSAVFGTFTCGILCQVWYLIVSFPNL